MKLGTPVHIPDQEVAILEALALGPSAPRAGVAEPEASAEQDTVWATLRLADGTRRRLPAAALDTDVVPYRLLHSSSPAADEADESSPAPTGTGQAGIEPTGVEPADPIVLPLVAEHLDVDKRQVITGEVAVHIHTDVHQETIDLTLARQQVRVERRAVGREVERREPPREEADRLIVPIYEEVPVVERRLILREEIHLIREEDTTPYHDTLPLRRDRATVTRTAGDTAAAEAGS